MWHCGPGPGEKGEWTACLGSVTDFKVIVITHGIVGNKIQGCEIRVYIFLFERLQVLKDSAFVEIISVLHYFILKTK